MALTWKHNKKGKLNFFSGYTTTLSHQLHNINEISDKVILLSAKLRKQLVDNE
jgi:hypothetical protein